MAEIITKDSEEFKEITGWIKRTGKISTSDFNFKTVINPWDKRFFICLK